MLIAFFALCGVLQETEEPASLEQELAQLIEKTNALETFHVIYGIEGPDGEGEDMSLELVYRAPDLGRMIATVPEGQVETWIVGDCMYGRFPGEDSWRRALMPDPSPVHELLDELFPGEEGALEPGLRFVIAFAPDPESSKTNFDFRVERHPCGQCGRSALVTWLMDMQNRPSELFVEGETLGWNGDDVRCFVSRETGFLERVDKPSNMDKKPFLLREGHFDEPLDPSLVTLPDDAKEAEIDPELSRSLEQIYHPSLVRRSGFLRVSRQLETEERSWDELTRADWRAFLDALYREWNGAWYPRLLEIQERDTAEVADWVRSQRSKDDSDENRARLEQRVAEHRAELEEKLQLAETKNVESLPVIESVKVVRQELLDLEVDVIGDLIDELLREPALQHFDEELEKALEE